MLRLQPSTSRLPNWQTSEGKSYSKHSSLVCTITALGDRQYRIAEAHEKTFRWIFTEETNESQKWACFTDWLESDSQLYWITGKAGSGKSTLMKFITQYEVARDESITRIRKFDQYLSKWAANQRLIVASFYFWAAGSFFDTAHRGLYQSLLYQIFRQCPDLISRATPNLWEVLCLLNKPRRQTLLQRKSYD